MPELYDLSAITVGELLSKELKLPRFQRKSTWSEETRFQLALSLFKGYPMGTVVIKQGKSLVSDVEVDATYLIDGRQRKETFERMMNPEELWRWAAVTLKLQAKTTQIDVVNKFNEYVSDYFFGLEDWESERQSEDTLAAAPPDEVSLADAVDSEEEGHQFAPDVETPQATDAKSGLAFMQQVILSVHPMRKKGLSSRLREPFDFFKLIEPAYLIQDDMGKKSVHMISLLSWLRIQRERERAKGEDVFPPSQETFLGWLLQGVTDDIVHTKVEQLLGDRWPQIEHSLAIIRAVELKVRQSSVGLVEIREKASSEDEKKIFEIINTAGAKLTAAEILSATPSWNVSVESAPQTVQANTRDLYGELKVEFSEPVRRWDVAATLLDRLVPAAPLVFGNGESWSWRDIRAQQFERKVTLGFKVLSGYYQQKLMKSHVASLPADPAVAWGTLALEEVVTKSQSKLRDHWFFTYLSAWQFSFASSMSDAVALDFLLECTADWERKGHPSASGHLQTGYLKNAIQLFDRLLYQYLTDVWRGSSDSRIARNLELLTGPDAAVVTPPADPSDWSGLVDEVLSGRIGGRTYLTRQDSRMRLLLIYASAIMRLRPDDPLAGNQVDHIIPQRLFKQESNPSLSALTHHIGNLELLPAKTNNFKDDTRLKDLQDQNVIDAVEKFSRIEREAFANYSTATSVTQLVELRGAVLRHALTVDRPRLLADPDEYVESAQWVKA